MVKAFFRILFVGFSVSIFFISTSIISKAEVPPVVSGKVKVRWLGHGSVMLTSPTGKVILVDPWLSTKPNTPVEFLNPAEAFEKVDVVLITHGHVDHYMPDDLTAIVTRYNPKVFCVWELSLLIKNRIPNVNLGNFEMANVGNAYTYEGITFSMVSAAHTSDAQYTDFSAKPDPAAGNAIGYIIEFENGFIVYAAGDTGLMADMKIVIGDFYKPDLAILPIGGVFTLGPKEAGYACSLIRPDYVIPVHYQTFPVLTQDTGEFEKFVAEYAPRTKVIPLKTGEERQF
ncbi:MAG: metal-dependent hydrolase [Candidatus Omnitrophota bacterium]